MTDDSATLGVVCGLCGGPVYMETCENQGGVPGHYSVTAMECQKCGNRNTTGGCEDCGEVTT